MYKSNEEKKDEKKANISNLFLCIKQGGILGTKKNLVGFCFNGNVKKNKLKLNKFMRERKEFHGIAETREKKKYMKNPYRSFALRMGRKKYKIAKQVT